MLVRLKEWGGVDVDVENAHFAGGSLGAIIGTGFSAVVAIDPDPPTSLSDPSTVLNTATLAVPIPSKSESSTNLRSPSRTGGWGGGP